jgi:molybdate transport system ATP-binding protein
MLSVDFEKRFASGTTIRAAFEHEADTPAVTVLLGRSGGGKTTILRCLAGLERPEAGTIAYQHTTWFDARGRVNLSPQRRGIGFLFQDYALFPHMTVEENISFALAHEPAEARRARVRELVDEFQLNGLERRLPRQLSGGQQQRVALARAISRRPRLLLLDEPLAALDGPTRDEIRPGLKRFLSQLGIPAYVVTHDRLDAIVLGERVLIIEQGRIVQSGSTPDVFAHPVNADVARLVGIETVTTGVVTAASDGVLHIAVGPAVVHAQGRAAVGAEVDICIRAEDVTLSRDDPAGMSAQNQWHARIASIVSDAGVLRVTLDCGFPLTALVTRTAGDGLGLRENAHVWAVVKATAVTALPRAARS